MPSTEEIEEILKKYLKKYVVTRRRYTKKKKADVHNWKIYTRVFSAAYHHGWHKNCSADVKGKASEFANKIVKKWMERNKLTLQPRSLG